MSDNKRFHNIKTPDNDLIEMFAMKPIADNSLIIKNGVMFVLGGVSSGKSTLVAKLIKIYDSTIKPMILCFYSGFAPDETTTHHISSYKLSQKPYFIKLPTNLSMITFFNEFRYKRLKYSEMLLFMKSIMTDKALLTVLKLAYALFNRISKKFDTDDYMKRVHILMSTVATQMKGAQKQKIYESEFVMKTYAKRRKINYSTDPLLFISNVAVSLSKGFKDFEVTVQLTDNISSSFQKANNNNIVTYDFEPMLRVVDNNELQLIPSVCIFDDVAQFPLLTTEKPTQWVKDLFAETRRWQNTFIIAAQRHSLLNKSLRALTHTFFIGYSLIDDDLPRIAKEMPSNILVADDFIKLYRSDIKPFTFFVYNNKLGFNIIKL